VDCAHRYVDKYSDPSRVVCKHREDLCDSTSLGSITRAFKSIRIYPEASGLMDMALGHIKSLIDGVLTVSPKELYFGKISTCCKSPRFRTCRECSQTLTPPGRCVGGCRYFYPLCDSCGELYRSDTHCNHSSCIPFAAINAEMEVIVDTITGLPYSKFVRKHTENRKTLATHSGAKDLWDCLMGFRRVFYIIVTFRLGRVEFHLKALLGC